MDPLDTPAGSPLLTGPSLAKGAVRRGAKAVVKAAGGGVVAIPAWLTGLATTPFSEQELWSLTGLPQGTAPTPPEAQQSGYTQGVQANQQLRKQRAKEGFPVSAASDVGDLARGFGHIIASNALSLDSPSEESVADAIINHAREAYGVGHQTVGQVAGNFQGMVEPSDENSFLTQPLTSYLNLSSALKPVGAGARAASLEAVPGSRTAVALGKVADVIDTPQRVTTGVATKVKRAAGMLPETAQLHAAIDALVAAGRLTPEEAVVWKQGMTPWETAAVMHGLSPKLGTIAQTAADVAKAAVVGGAIGSDVGETALGAGTGALVGLTPTSMRFVPKHLRAKTRRNVGNDPYAQPSVGETEVLRNAVEPSTRVAGEHVDLMKEAGREYLAGRVALDAKADPTKQPGYEVHVREVTPQGEVRIPIDSMELRSAMEGHVRALQKDIEFNRQVMSPEEFAVFERHANDQLNQIKLKNKDLDQSLDRHSGLIRDVPEMQVPATTSNPTIEAVIDRMHNQHVTAGGEVPREWFARQVTDVMRAGGKGAHNLLFSERARGLLIEQLVKKSGLKGKAAAKFRTMLGDELVNNVNTSRLGPEPQSLEFRLPNGTVTDLDAELGELVSKSKKLMPEFQREATEKLGRTMGLQAQQHSFLGGIAGEANRFFPEEQTFKMPPKNPLVKVNQPQAEEATAQNRTSEPAKYALSNDNPIESKPLLSQQPESPYMDELIGSAYVPKANRFLGQGEIAEPVQAPTQLAKPTPETIFAQQLESLNEKPVKGMPEFSTYVRNMANGLERGDAIPFAVPFDPQKLAAGLRATNLPAAVEFAKRLESGEYTPTAGKPIGNVIDRAKLRGEFSHKGDGLWISEGAQDVLNTRAGAMEMAQRYESMLDAVQRGHIANIVKNVATRFKRGRTLFMLPTITHNALSNDLLGAVTNGKAPLQTMREGLAAAQRMADFYDGKTPATPETTRMYRGLSRAGIGSMQNLADDVASLTSLADSLERNDLSTLSSRAANALENLGAHAYHKFGDLPFKIGEAESKYKAIMAELQQLKPGEKYTVDLPHQRSVELTRTANGLEALGQEYPLDSQKIADLAATEAVKSASDLFANPNESGLLWQKLRQSDAGSIVSPFLTWATHMTDLPGKQGAIGRLLEGPKIRKTTSPTILLQNAKELAKFAVRRATLLGSLQGAVDHKNDDLRAFAAFHAGDLGTIDVRGTGDGRADVSNHASIDPFSPTTSLFTLGRGAVAGILGPGAFSKNMTPDQKKRFDAWAQFEGNKLGTAADALRVIGLSGGPFLDQWRDAMDSSARHHFDGRKAALALTVSIMGGTPTDLTRVAAEALSPGNEWSGRPMAGDNPEDFAKWAFRTLIGLGAREIVLKGKHGEVQRYIGKSKSAVHDTIITPLKNELAKINKQSRTDKSPELSKKYHDMKNQINILEKALDEVSNTMKTNMENALKAQRKQ